MIADREYPTKLDLDTELAEHLANLGFPEEICRPIAEEISPSMQPVDSEFKAARKVFFKKWVVRDDDLKLVDAICAGLTAGAAGATGGPLLSAGAAVVAAILKLLYSVYRKGAKITHPQYKVLLGLRCNPNGLTEVELGNWLRTNYPSETFQPDALKLELSLLEALALKDGTVAKLANKDAANRWYAAGV